MLPIKQMFSVAVLATTVVTPHVRHVVTHHHSPTHVIVVDHAVSKPPVEKHASHKKHVEQSHTTPAQWMTSGPGIAYPDATDPTWKLPRIDQLAFSCIRYHESRNHVVDNGNGSYGWYQFTPSTWNAAAVALHFPTNILWNPNLATKDQQSAVAVWYFERNGRLGVQWAAESGDCPGTFYFN